MIFKRINRTDAESVFIVLQANEAGVAADDVVQLELVAASVNGVLIVQPNAAELNAVVGIADAAIGNAAFGLVPAPQAGERPDHVSCECEFLMVLARKEALVLHRGDAEMPAVIYGINKPVNIQCNTREAGFLVHALHGSTRLITL